MKRFQSLSEEAFLRLFFLLFSCCFLVAAPLMPDRQRMLTGLWEIITAPCKSQTNYFGIGGFSATFLNMGLIGLICAGLYCLPGKKPANTYTLATILTVGFGAWGINPVNVLPTFLGVVVFCLVKKARLGEYAHAMLFSTGIAPLITDLMVRYPHPEVVGHNPLGACVALLVGFVIGFLLPAGLVYSPKVHRGFDLYSAALPVGMTAFFLNGVLYKTLGIPLPGGPAPEIQAVASASIVNLFCGAMFLLCILFALLLGCRPGDYRKLLTNPEQVKSVSGQYGNGVFLMNVGVFGLFILAYYNLVGATFNGVIFGIVFCMLSTCNSGSHPANVLPIMLGYLLAAAISWGLSTFLGGTFEYVPNAQAIVVGLCYANGLSPISDKYGWKYGVLAAAMHYLLVTSVPTLHGGYCLYNGGFTAALVCVLLIPQLEQRVLPEARRRYLSKQ